MSEKIKVDELFYFERMPIWKLSRALVNRVYDASALFPKEEKYGLSDQIRRAVVSIASNISESTGRISNRDRLRFLDFAYGSLMEVRCQLIVAYDREYIDITTLQTISHDIVDIYRMLVAMRKHLHEEPDINTF